MTAPSERLRGMRLFLTAATRGIGFAVAERVHAEGADVVVTGSRPVSLEAAAAELRSRPGGEVHAVLLDVGDKASIESGAAQARAALGGIDGLFLNVPGAAAGHLGDLDEHAWSRAFELHVLSVLRLVEAVRDDLEKAMPGRVVAITSYSAREPIDGLALSNVVRPSVHALVKEMARAYGPRGLLVNAIAPGRIETERVQQVDAAQAARQGVDPVEVRRTIAATIPLGRYGAPAELAHVAAFLLSRENTYVTGQNLLVDGGLVRAQ